jgi:acyl-CoA oxidase
MIRECFGGHGYSDYAGITNLLDIAAPNVTLEGDNHVMYQQTARGLLKAVAKIMQGKKLEGSFSYINELMHFEGSKLSKFNPDNLEHLESILKAHALYQIARTAKLLQMDREGTFEDKWNKKYQADAVKMSNAHAVYMTADSFLTALKTLKLSDGLKKHMTTLCKIHLCHSVLTYADGALLSGFVKAKHLFMIQEFMYEKIDEVAPQLLNLIEAFHYPEGSLITFVQPESGDVYNQLYQAAALNPINAKPKLDAFDECVVPLSKRMSAGM